LYIIRVKTLKDGELMSDVRDRVDLGTWGAFRTGWWVLHAAGIIAIGYLGYWVGTMNR
jgi:hypothetical protein